MIDEDAIQYRWETVGRKLDERGRRLFAAAEVRTAGWGAGLKVECALDTRTYEKGIKVSAAEMATLNIAGDDFHPEWNYTIKPRLKPNS
jgi:hypothetical protein